MEWQRASHAGVRDYQIRSQINVAEVQESTLTLT